MIEQYRGFARTPRARTFERVFVPPFATFAAGAAPLPACGATGATGAPDAYRG